jgi:hypothetical protein
LFKEKILLVGIINKNVESNNENHITYQTFTETKHTNCMPLILTAVSYYENHRKSSSTMANYLNTTGNKLKCCAASL